MVRGAGLRLAPLQIFPELPRQPRGAIFVIGHDDPLGRP
jgi:hypothetical protein